jgi:S1-C subfamily serine protease
MTSFGHISTWWSVMPGEISTIGFDSAVTFGMSGGGLFDIEGKLVGIVIQKSTLIQSDNRAVRYNEIEEALPELRAGAQNP